MRDLSWQELIDLATAESGDAETTEAVWSEIRRRVGWCFAKIRRTEQWLTAGGAEDFLQQLLLRMHQPGVFAAIRSARTPHAYVMRMARNTVTDHGRRQVTHRAALEEIHPSAIPLSPGDAAAVSHLMQTVTPEEQQLLKMTFWEGMSIREIAQALELPYSTVAKRSLRLLQRLRMHFGRPEA